jgi:hypothetical protein
MFCDLVGSTALSTRHDPEDLRVLIGDYDRAVSDFVGAGFHDAMELDALACRNAQRAIGVPIGQSSSARYCAAISRPPGIRTHYELPQFVIPLVDAPAPFDK